MRLIMMGTGPFAVPTFRALLHSRHEVPLLVTRPSRPARGRRNKTINPMREVAQERSLPIFEPESINTDPARAELARYEPDLFVVADYGQILKPATLAVAQLGGINLHGSLLPKYRGAAPINWAIYHGETETGVTVIHMTPQLDAGPTLAQARTKIAPDETAVDLEPRLAELGAPLVLQTIDALERGDAQPLPQDSTAATKAPRLDKTDGAIDWNRSAQEIKNQVRAMEPWPKTYTFWRRPGSGEPMRLILGRVQVEPFESDAPPGTVLEAGGDRLLVATGSGALAIESLQPAGKRLLSVDEFLRGYGVLPGERFESEGTTARDASG